MNGLTRPVLVAGRALLISFAFSCALPPTGGAQAARQDHGQILSALRPRLAHARIPYSCVRLRDQDPEAIVVVLRTAFVRRARAALRAAGIDGRVEVRARGPSTPTKSSSLPVKSNWNHLLSPVRRVWAAVVASAACPANANTR
jgi:hypothetical protein